MWKKAPHSWALICIDQKELFYRNTTIADIWNWRQERNESGKFRFNASELMQTFDYLLRQKLNIAANLKHFLWNLCLWQCISNIFKQLRYFFKVPDFETNLPFNPEQAEHHQTRAQS